MKRTNISCLLLLLFSAFFFCGCEKELDSEGLSRTTYFPDFTMKGEQYMSLVVGEAYNEAGVTATEEGDEIEVTAAGTVDIHTPGVYDITYTATNKDGFSSKVTRTVAVLSAAEQEGVDISGDYVYSSGSPKVTVKKLAPGLYLQPNVWGGSTIGAYILTTDGENLVLPESALSVYGTVSGTGKIDSNGKMTLKVNLLDYGIMGRERIWQKQ
ncbi:uncharacterized protein DUF5011 [Pontibacter ummariensis]|uniref:Pesticidal crystal protein Cry22Aa Ig-like domain-containing protein n=1 Tax=Pontibacter ummariensis TaxID=1610492 RepID=A0A239IWH2_9BACT|nr:DUF5011 domain-containing protein [Pontibacter ummariensis]PRY08995.1 uncharacterized protein DUF5011 [Pontibacter ummariensis]SNS97919.1 protein of unknown function [Pontibacter ummariensis]